MIEPPASNTPTQCWKYVSEHQRALAPLRNNYVPSKYDQQKSNQYSKIYLPNEKAKKKRRIHSKPKSKNLSIDSNSRNWKTTKALLNLNQPSNRREQRIQSSWRTCNQ